MSQVDRDMGEASRWLKDRRERLGASTSLVARMATLVASRQGDPVRIHQQQISEIENWRPDRGPRSLRPWFRHVRSVFDSGLIADALGKSDSEGATIWQKVESDEQSYSVHDAAGRTVGRLTLFGCPSERQAELGESWRV